MKHITIIQARASLRNAQTHLALAVASLQSAHADLTLALKRKPPRGRTNKRKTK